MAKVKQEESLEKQLCKAADKLRKNTRDTLLPKLMSGEVRVKN